MYALFLIPSVNSHKSLAKLFSNRITSKHHHYWVILLLKGQKILSLK